METREESIQNSTWKNFYKEVGKRGQGKKRKIIYHSPFPIPYILNCVTAILPEKQTSTSLPGVRSRLPYSPT